MASGRALAASDPEGFVKLIYGEKYGELLGAHIIGAEATELIAEMGLAITLEATYEETREHHPRSPHPERGDSRGHRRRVRTRDSHFEARAVESIRDLVTSRSSRSA